MASGSGKPVLAISTMVRDLRLCLLAAKSLRVPAQTPIGGSVTVSALTFQRHVACAAFRDPEAESKMRLHLAQCRENHSRHVINILLRHGR